LNQIEAKNCFENVDTININVLRIVMLYELFSNLVSYVQPYVGHVLTDQLLLMVRGSQDLLLIMHERYRDELLQLVHGP
jgi:hypothetical protein